MSFPNKVMSGPYLSDKDKADLLFGIENDVDFIAASFVSKAEDLIELQEFLNANGGQNIDIVAKIENRSGVENIEEICAECSGIMVARGDLGVEIPYEELPAIQKLIIDKCRLLGKRVITATEMLESMIHNVRPTRAEISDVANAVYDGTSAIMLSGETAAGEHPVLAVEAMARIAERTETTINYEKRFRQSEFRIRNTVDALSHATCGMAIDIGAAAIAVCTISGMTARMVSRFRPPVDITGLTTDERTWRRLALSWGVTPVLCEVFNSTDVLFYTAKNLTRQAFDLQKGDRLVLTGGITNGTSGNTDIIKLETI
jgi:pyruvate kinase